MIDETLDELKQSSIKAHESLKRSLSTLRTGRANPALLDFLRVDYFGTLTPISQLANITVPEARMLMIKAWDKTNVKGIERCIMESDLGLNPQVDGELIRVPLPPLTEERRRDLVKIARKSGEECKISIRKSRQEARGMLDALKSEGEASEDDVKAGQKKIEEIVQQSTGVVDDIVALKEKDIMQV